MKRHNLVSVLCISLLCFISKAQDTISFSSSLLKEAFGVDSKYIKTFTLPNDVRIIAGGQGAAIGFQSKHDGSLKLDLQTYNNVSDLIGFGLTYKFIDFDLMTSLKSSVILPDGRQNLSQFKTSFSYTARKNSFRFYYSKSDGMISTDPQIDYQSSADIYFLKVGAQITHICNSKRYSYRAANFQSELQTKSAGSFLVRIEPFYRELGMSGASISNVARNTDLVFDKQAGLRYLYSPGMVIMPGYGLNLVVNQGKFYACPMMLLGPGFSVNNYEGNRGKFNSFNLEASSVLMINSGYNGSRMYVNLRSSADLCYSYFDPTLFSTTEIKIYLTIGVRFRNVENKIPSSFL